MKKIFYLAFVTFMLVCSISCDEEEESALVVFLTPQEAIIETNTNEHVFLKLEARATKGEISSFKITQKDEYAGILSLVDSSLGNIKFVNYDFDYIVPEFPDSTETLLTFTINDNLGNQIQTAKRLIINKGSSLISESSGHVIYSSLSDKPNAFNIKNLAPNFSTDLIDKEIDFMDNSVDSINGNDLSRTWLSKNDLNFVQYNSFNYALANSTMISNAYESGIKLNKITNITDNNVFLVGKDHDAIGAIQIISVVDSDSTLNDKYVFNIKVIDTYIE